MAGLPDLDFSNLEPIEPDPATAGDGVEPAVKVSRHRSAGSRSYALLVPLTVDGRRLRRVTMAHPEQGDIDDWAAGVVPGRRVLICRMCDLDPLVFRRLAWPDAQALHQMFADMVPDFILHAEE